MPSTINFFHKCYLLFLCILSSIGFLSAQEIGKPFIQNFSPSDYNAYPQNWCVVQGTNGLIYIGNNFGVLEFDGKTWRLIPTDNNGVVRSMALHQQDIYIGAQGEFGYLKANTVGTLEYTSLSQSLPDTLKSQFTNVWETHSLKDRVYFRTDNYIFSWDGKKLNWFKSKGSGGFQRSYVVNEELWVIDTDWGITRLKNDEFELMPNGAFFKGSIYGLLPYQDKLMVVTKKHIYTFDYKGEGETSVIFTDLPSELIYQSILVKNEGYLFATLGEGVIMTDLEGDVVREITTESGLLDNVVINIGLDHQNGVWLGLNNGISRVELFSPISYFDELDKLGLGVNDIARYKGKLYAGTDVGVYSLEGNNQFSLLEGTEEHQVWDLHVHKSQNEEFLIIGTSSGSLLYDGMTLKAKISGAIFAIIQNPFDSLSIFGTSSSSVFGSKNIKEDAMLSFFNTKLPSQVRSLAISEADSTLWACTNYSGIGQIQLFPKSGRTPELIQIHDSITGLENLQDIYAYPINGEVIFATPKGFLTFNKDDKRFVFSESGIAKTAGRRDIYRLATRNNNDTWLVGVASRNSPFQVIGQDGDTYRDKQHPLGRLPAQSVETIFHEANGISWIGGSVGIFRIDNQLTGNGKPYDFQGIIRKVTVNSDSLIFGGTSLYQKLPAVDYDFRNFTFYYASNAYDALSEVKYSYRLKNYDKEWSAWGQDSKQHYTNLAEGKYEFQVKAKDVYGNESEIGSFNFEVKPPIYRTIFAYVCYLAVFAFIIYASAKLYGRKLRKEKARLEEIVRIRTSEIQEQKNDILEKNTELEQQTEEIMSQRDLLNEQNIQIQKKSRQISDSINYAQRIQTSMMPSEAQLQSFLKDGFVFFKPKDIVSGDFYWIGEINGLKIIALADCTGHGIPGAFMSMVGDALLDQIITEKKTTSPQEILTSMHRGIRHLLRQEETSNQDGMDISIACIDEFNKKINFAGAKSRILLMQEGKVQVFRGSKYSVGGQVREINPVFTEEEITYREGARLFLFSDGYADQFGGKGNKKISYKKMQQILCSESHASMSDKKAELGGYLESWMEEGKENQIDDILVLGFQLA